MPESLSLNVRMFLRRKPEALLERVKGYKRQFPDSYLGEHHASVGLSTYYRDMTSMGKNKYKRQDAASLLAEKLADVGQNTVLYRNEDFLRNNREKRVDADYLLDDLRAKAAMNKYMYRDFSSILDNFGKRNVLTLDPELTPFERSLRLSPVRYGGQD